MPKPVLRDVQPNFVGGLNLSSDISELAPNEVRSIENMRISRGGGIELRRGTRRVHTTSFVGGGFTGGHFHKLTGTDNELLVTHGGTLYTAPSVEFASLLVNTPLSWTARTGALATNFTHSFANFDDVTASGSGVVYIADGGPLNKWDPDAATLSVDLAGTPNVRFVATHNNRLFGVGDSDNPYRLYWSDLANGDTLGIVSAGGGFADIKTFGESDLIGLMSIGESLMIFHRDGISRFTGWAQDDIDIQAGTRGVSTDTGTALPHTLVAVENTGFFLARNGFYMITEGGVTPISAKIDQFFADNPVLTTFCSAAHNEARQEIFFSITGVGILVYNYRYQQWVGPMWPDVDYAPDNALMLWSVVDLNNQSGVFGAYEDDFVRWLEATDNFKDDLLSDGSGGTSYIGEVQCHRMFCNTPTLEKAYRWAFVGIDMGGANQFSNSLAWLTHTNGGANILIVPYTGFVGTVTCRTGLNGSGPYIDLTLTVNSAGAALNGNTVKINRVEIHAFAMGERYG